MQSSLVNRQRAPDGNESFKALREDESLAFRDFTPYFQLMGLLSPRCSSVTSLHRGHRWGKTVLGEGWLAFLSGQKELFKGTWVEREGKMRNDRFIAIKLDFSKTQTSIEDIINTIETAIQEALNTARTQSTDHPIFKTYSNTTSNWTLDHSLSHFSRMCGHLLCMRALHEGDLNKYKMLSQFFSRFFTILKANTKYIPFQFFTGSIQLPLKEFWSSANNILDLSFLASSAAVGYTWDDIQSLYSTQLSWLAMLHNLKPEQLQRKIEEWYGQHRWSSGGSNVFNPWNIQMLIKKGEFDTYWASSEAPFRLVSSKFLVQRLVRSLLYDEVISIHRGSLDDSCLPRNNLEISDETQIGQLVIAGILTINPKFSPSIDDFSTELVIPNLDAKEAICRILLEAVPVSQSFLSDAGAFITDNDMIGLLHLMSKTNALNDTLHYFKSSSQKLSEFHISMAFSFLIVLAKNHHVIYHSGSPLNEKEQITYIKQSDVVEHVFQFPAKDITHIVAFKIKSKSSPQSELVAALKQSLSYKVVKDAEKVLYSGFVFDGDGKLQLATLPVSHQKAEELIEYLQLKIHPRSILSHPLLWQSDVNMLKS